MKLWCSASLKKKLERNRENRIWIGSNQIAEKIEGEKNATEKSALNGNRVNKQIKIAVRIHVQMEDRHRHMHTHTLKYKSIRKAFNARIYRFVKCNFAPAVAPCVFDFFFYKSIFYDSLSLPISHCIINLLVKQ